MLIGCLTTSTPVSGRTMSPVAQKITEEYQVLLLALQDVFGVVVGEERHGSMLEKLKQVVAARGLTSIEALAEALRDQSATELRASVLQAITSHDSVWFSYPEVAKLLNGYVLPAVINKNRMDYRIWLIGCGTGQMAYSQAMTVDAFRRKHNMAGDIEIVATDLLNQHSQAGGIGSLRCCFAGRFAGALTAEIHDQEK